MIVRNMFLKLGLIFCFAILILFVSLSESTANENKQPNILEIVSFKTSDNVTSNQLMEASDKVTTDLQKYPGFIKRTLTQNTENPDQWIDIIEWKSLDDAHNSMSNALENKDVQDFLKLMKHGERTYQTKSEFLNIQSQTN